MVSHAAPILRHGLRARQWTQSWHYPHGDSIGFHRSGAQPCSHPSNHIPIHPPTHPSIHNRSIHPSNHLPVHPSIPPSDHSLVLASQSFLSSFRRNKLSLPIPLPCQIPAFPPIITFQDQEFGTMHLASFIIDHCDNFVAVVENYNTDIYFNMFTKSKLSRNGFIAVILFWGDVKLPRREVSKRTKEITPQS